MSRSEQHKLSAMEKIRKTLRNIRVTSSDSKQKDEIDSPDASKLKPTEITLVRTLPPPNNAQLGFAIYDKSPDKIIDALKGNIDINAPSPGGMLPIISLMHNLKYEPRLPELVERFLEAGANVDTKDDFGYTLLIYAISHSLPIDVIKILIKAGTDLNAKNDYGETSLSFAANRLSDRYSPDHVKTQMREIISLLLSNGADILGLPDDKKYGLIRDLMAYAPDENDARYILRNWMPIDQYKNQLLSMAILSRKWEISEDLVKMGAVINFRSIPVYDMDNSTLVKILDIAHPNPLVAGCYKCIFSIINHSINAYKINLAKPEIYDSPQYSLRKIKEFEEKKLILTQYLYSYLRDLGGYFQSGVLPTDLLKLIGDEIVH